VPNVVSFIRLGMIPVFVWRFLTAESRSELVVSFVLLGLIGGTDWVDGFLARRLHQVSVLGQLIDPVADRLAIIVAIIAIMIRTDNVIPIPVAASILVREAIIALTFGALEAKGYPRLPVNRTGKAATACIFTGMAFGAGSLVASESITEIMRVTGIVLLGAGSLLYWIAALFYFRQIRAMLQKGLP
ncbi:MAG: CDP-alcohol phosphatidyltransferase family protein, partial [Acidimicrobiia bacterium]